MYASKLETVIYKYIRVNQNIFQTIRTIHTKSNHYEILKVKPNCTAKDIRDAFLKLSKENHPDVSTGENAKRNADNFRAVVEAYKILGKVESRAIYDSVMQQGRGSMNYSYAERTHVDMNHPSANGAYYGIFGSKRISNKKVVMYCMIFMVVGIIVQALAIRHSVTFRRDKLDQISMKAGKVHSEIRAHAVEYGNDHQLNKLVQKSTKSDN